MILPLSDKSSTETSEKKIEYLLQCILERKLFADTSFMHIEYPYDLEKCFLLAWLLRENWCR